MNTASMNFDPYVFRSEIVEETCHRCATKFQRHKESEVFICLSCYEEAVIRERTRKDTIFFILKICSAAALIVFAFFRYTTSKSGSKNAQVSGLIESMAAAAAGVWIGKSAFDKFKKTRKVK